MRILPIGAALAVAMFSAGMSQSQASPLHFGEAPASAAQAPLVQVQMQCNASRCIDPRTGAYTQSGCNRHGCYPISGVVGYSNPNGGGYGSSYPHRRWERERYDRDHWGR